MRLAALPQVTRKVWRRTWSLILDEFIRDRREWLRRREGSAFTRNEAVGSRVRDVKRAENPTLRTAIWHLAIDINESQIALFVGSFFYEARRTDESTFPLARKVRRRWDTDELESALMNSRSKSPRDRQSKTRNESTYLSRTRQSRTDTSLRIWEGISKEILAFSIKNDRKNFASRSRKEDEIFRHRAKRKEIESTRTFR